MSREDGPTGCEGKDLIRPVGTLPDGRLLVSRHRSDHSTELATVRKATDGSPMAMGEELVTTHRRADGSIEVTGSYVRGASAPRSGPAQVATAEYRAGWERVFTAPGGSA